ncbi:hypothetical protein MKX03_007239 [Papaver bracteatum]|nr:hypothetical protein MKX03_007239 [Papaver bracteatum]
MLPKRDAVRSSHRYKSAPDIVLFKELLSLCSDKTVSAEEIIGRAYHVTETFVQAILYVKSQFRKLVGSCDLSSTYSEGNRDNDDTSSDVGSSSVGSLSTDKLLELLSQGDIWLGRAELLEIKMDINGLAWLYTVARTARLSRKALQLYKVDPAPFILEIINIFEGGPLVDVSAVRMYETFGQKCTNYLGRFSIF